MPKLRAPRPAPAPVRKVEMGRSVKGTPLVLEVFGNGPERIFIFGGIHGNEPTSAAVAKALADHLRINWQLFAGRTLALLVAANPDGLALGQRTNANGVDLNRNFPAKNWQRLGRLHGSRPASEPETQAIMQAVELIRPHRIVAIHSITGRRWRNNFDGPAEHLAELMAGINGYPVKAGMGYPTPGSFGSWAGVDRSIPTVTLELPRTTSRRQAWRENKAALLAFIEADREAAGR